MIRTKNEQAVEFKCIRNGNGETEMRKILNGEEELYGKGRLFNHMSTRIPMTTKSSTFSPAAAPIMTMAIS